MVSKSTLYLWMKWYYLTKKHYLELTILFSAFFFLTKSNKGEMYESNKNY